MYIVSSQLMHNVARFARDYGQSHCERILWENRKPLKTLSAEMKVGGATGKKIKSYLQIADPITFGPISDRLIVAVLSGYNRRMKRLAEKSLHLGQHLTKKHF